MDKRALRHINLKDGGFTLVELMITVAILVILLAIGAPSLQTFVAKRSVSTQAEIFSSALRMTRSEAIKRSLPVTICASNNPDAATRSCAAASKNWATGWIVFIDRDANGTFSDTQDELLSVQQALPASGGINLANSLTSIRFANNGLPQGLVNRTFTVSPTLAASNGGASPLNLCVIISTTGRVRTAVADKTTGLCS